MLRKTKTKSKKFRIRWSKVPRVLEPLNRVMAILVTRPATAVSSRKTPKMAINRDFPGLRAFFSKCRRRQKRTARNSASDGQKYRQPLKSSYGHFSHPAGHGRFQAEKKRKMAINRDFPELRAFSANVAGDKNEEQEIPHPMVKSTARFGAPKSSYGHFSHPAGHGRFKPKNTQNGNKSRFPGATCIFSKCRRRQKRTARNSASDGQKYRAFWSP